MKTAVRRVLLMSALLSPSALYALGLGEITLNSALNQPFDADIELVSAAQEDLSALRAALASNDTFQRYGLDKPSYLSDFTFRVVKSGGRDVLKVTSPRPVTEPFVTLLVEASWPRGRLLREYTVLLDPPVFAPTPSAAEPPVAAPRATAAPTQFGAPAESRAAAAAAPAPAPAPREPRPSQPAAAAAIEPGSTYRVRPNDTLSKIAGAAYPGGRTSVNRAMVAIYQANPAAFGGNINVLRAGSELRMPSSSDVSAISASAAADEVARQYQLWKEGAVAAPEAADGGRLRLVTPEQGSAIPSTATPAAQPPAAAPAGDLQAKVQQLEAELAEARRLLEVRNAELATLQGGAEPAGEAPPAEAPPAAPGTETVPPGETAVAPPASATGEPAAAAEEPAAAPEQPKKTPTPAAEPEAGPSVLDRVFEYWWVLIGVLAAVLAVMFFARSRRKEGAAEDELEQALGRRSDDLRARAAAAPAKESSFVVEERKLAEPSPNRASAAAPEPSRKPVTVEDTLSGEGPVSIESGDPLAEADFHMAYGLYDQAADLIQVAAKREPQRRDFKLKLLEIFFVWGNRDRFMELAREMQATRRDAQPGEWDKVLIMGRQLAPEDPLFAGAVSAAADSLDMELHPSDSALDIEFPPAGAAVRPDVDLTVREPRAQLAGGGDLDFLLDEPQRGATDESTVPTVETPRLRASSTDDPTAEVAIEDLGIDIDDITGLDEFTEPEADLLKRTPAAVEDTVERPSIESAARGEDDLLSSTSIMGGDTIAEMIGEPEPGVIDLSDVTGELPTVETSKLEVTGLMKMPDFAIEGEATTMSEVGTKLDLARAYIDMGDPEGARSILEEVLKEGSAGQRKEAERLLASLP
jgi:pilus assembly protein FimV